MPKLSDINAPIQVICPMKGSVMFRQQNLNDIALVEDLITQNIEPRKFCITVLANQIFEPTKSNELLDSWNDEELLSLSHTWLTKVTKTTVEQESRTFKEFLRILSLECEAHTAKLHKLFEGSLKQTTIASGALDAATLQSAKQLSAIADSNQLALDKFNSVLRNAELAERNNSNRLEALSFQNEKFTNQWRDLVGEHSNHLEKLATNIQEIGLSTARAMAGLTSQIDNMNIASQAALNAFGGTFSASMQSAINGFRNPISPDIQAAMNSLRNPVSSDLQAAMKSMNSSIGSFQAAIKGFSIVPNPFGNILAKLPSISELRIDIAALWLETAKEELTDSDFGFIVHALTKGQVIYLVGSDGNVREPHITNRVAAFTRSDSFFALMEKQFKDNPILKRRWPIIFRALEQHRNRNYIMSVPVLIAQTEGVLTDLMVLRQFVTIKNGKCYVKNSKGKIELVKRKDKMGNDKWVPDELSGLGRKITRSRTQGDAVLNTLADKFLDDLAPQRNKILHGSKTSYGTAKLSTSLLLTLFILGREVN